MATDCGCQESWLPESLCDFHLSLWYPSRPTPHYLTRQFVENLRGGYHYTSQRHNWSDNDYE